LRHGRISRGRALVARAVRPGRISRGRALVASAALVAVLALVALPVVALADDISVSASADRRTVSLNGQLTLTVTAEGTMQQISPPTLPDLDEHFSVYSAGSSSNMRWVNGQMSSSRSWTYRLLPRQTGTVTIGAIEVEFGGSVYSTEPIEVEVVEGDAPPAEREERVGSGVDAEGRDVFITTSVDKERAYVGEQVTLSFKFYRRVDLWEQPRYQAPELPGFWVVDDPEQEEYYETVEGVRYIVIEIRTAVFGTSPGTATIGPASLTYRERAAPVTFFSRPGRLVTLTTDPIDIDVLPLPAEGRPDSFGGAVGNFNLSVSLDEESVDQYRPVTLRITFAGNGNIRTVPDPELPDLPEFRVYESGTSTDTNTRNGIVGGRKTFEYVLIPQTEGPKTIPGIDLAFFDPGRKTYRTVGSPELTLAVAPAPEGQQDFDAPARAAISRLGQDIRYIHEPGGLLRAASDPLYRRPSFALLQLVPVLALAGAILVRRRRDMFAREEGLARFVKAPGRARKELGAARGLEDAASVCSAVARILTDFIGDRFKVAARGMTLQELSRVLERAGASGELTGRVERLLSECDLGRFAGGASGVESGNLVSEAEGCLTELERLSARRRR
jgi:hypothetical protein